MVSFWQRAAVLLAVTFMSVAAAAVGGVVTVEADRTTITQNESFKVTYTYTADLDNEPGFEVLSKDFDILGQNRSSKLRSVNGRFSYSFTWDLTLMPKRAGNLTLPPVLFDGTPSQSLEISVREASSVAGEPLQDLSLETELTPSEGYVQGQFIYTLRLFHRGWLQGGNLSEPDFGDSDAIVRELDQVKSYTIFRDGERIHVYEQSYLVFPQSSGTLTAKAAAFTGHLKEPGRARRLKRVSAPARSAVVQPVPAQLSGGDFLPATNLLLEETWPSGVDEFEQGQPITREVRVIATGLTAAQLPELSFGHIEGVKVYPDQAQREDRLAQDGVTGVLTQALAIVPQRSGDITVPELAVTWWDTKSGESRRAILPERTVRVVAPAGASALTPSPASGATATEAALAVQNGASTTSTVWRNVAFTLLGLWLLTLALWRWQARPAANVAGAAAPTASRNVSLFKARAAVKNACNAADPHAAISAMLELAGVLWKASPPQNFSALRARVDGELGEELGRLSAACYGKNAQWDEPHKLWRLVAQWRPEIDANVTASPVDSTLAPL